MKVKWILENMDQFVTYKGKLSFIDRHQAKHSGAPMRYPCIAMSELEKEGGKDSQWTHIFIYASSRVELQKILDNGENVTPLNEVPISVSTETNIEQTPDEEKTQWEKFWDDIDKAQNPAPALPKSLEWDEYSRLYSSLHSLTYVEGIARCKVYLARWPSGSYRDLVESRKAQLEYALEQVTRRSTDPAPVTTVTRKVTRAVNFKEIP